MASPNRSSRCPELLERADARPQLDRANAELRGGRGGVVLVHGEAGIGKTTLVRAFLADETPDVRVLQGRCDDLLVPRPLGSVLELVDGLDTAPDLGAHPGRELVRMLRQGPTLCIVEDVHWADEATLDVLTYVTRRVEELPLLLILTFRDDELPPDHPLHRTLAAAPPTHCRSVELAPLSLDAVRRMAASDAEAATIHRITGGNPFFVSEALAGGLDDPPGTVREAVLGRAARLAPAARHTAELVSVVPGRAEPWLVEECLRDAADIAACETQGLLIGDRHGIRFRHELARRVVEESLAGQHRRELNRIVLRALVAAGAPDARLAHHAWQAGDAESVVRHGLNAASRAAENRAHREAAELFSRVLEHADLLTPRDRADTLEAFAAEASAACRHEDAVAAGLEALTLRREFGDPRRTGDCLRALSRIQWCAGDGAGAERTGREAIAVLEGCPPCRETAMALSNQSQLAMLAQRDDEATTLGQRALEIATAVDDTETVVHALVSIGTAVGRTDLEAGAAMLDQAARAAGELGDDHTACRALINASWLRLDAHQLAAADALVTRALALAVECDLTIYVDCLHEIRALLMLATGHYDTALREVARSRAPMVPALYVRASVALRRGEADASDRLETGWRRAVANGELLRLGPMACARAEAAWLRSDPAGVDEATRTTYELALARGTPRDIGELALWRHRAGVLSSPVPDRLPKPYALELAGDNDAAARVWQELGLPYAAALALLGSTRPDGILAAIEILERLGAVAVLPLARARLRELGSTRVPRGRASTTRRNPCGLTDRQLEVARLLVRGRSNAEIAQTLVLSPKTIEHHVGAVLAKVGAAGRDDVAVQTRRLGVVLDRADPPGGTRREREGADPISRKERGL